VTLTDTTRERLAALSGLVPTAVGEALAELAARVPADQAIVEIGSFKGKSTCYLAAGAKAGRGAHVYAVDPWDLAGNVTGRFGFAEPSTREAFDAQIRSLRLASRVTPIQGFSVEVARAWEGPPVGLLFIDGDHSAKAVAADVAAWTPHLTPDAVLVLDDLDTPKNPGVRQVFDQLASRVDWTVTAERLAVGTFR
jgi:predicted O-methyltransferase YrrM